MAAAMNRLVGAFVRSIFSQLLQMAGAPLKVARQQSLRA